MKRELTSHKVNGLNEALAIIVLDEPGQGNACHDYAIIYNRSTRDGEPGAVTGEEVRVRFQNGPIKEAGVNGISQEALLAIIEDRLVGFQAGPYATEDNAEALEHVRKAMECLHRRTKERMARGVEGTMAR